jgi:hypothetical protein
MDPELLLRHHYRRDGTPLTDVWELVALYENPMGIDVGYTQLVSPTGSLVGYVSTTWLALDMSTGKANRPVIFETAVFWRDPTNPTYIRRYCTETEAQRGHVIAVMEMANTYPGLSTRDVNRYTGEPI